jgi:hypothetical protein
VVTVLRERVQRWVPGDEICQAALKCVRVGLTCATRIWTKGR